MTRLKSLNSPAIWHAARKGWFTAWEREFYLDILHKRNLSPRQRIKKVELNVKFTAGVARNA